MLRHPPTFTLFPYTTLFRSIMALARLDIPGLILYGGSIAPGQFEGHSVTILDGDGMPLELTGSDGAAIENQAGNVEASERHDRSEERRVGKECKGRGVTEHAKKKK